MWSDPRETAGLVAFSGEILMGGFNFWASIFVRCVFPCGGPLFCAAAANFYVFNGPFVPGVL